MTKISDLSAITELVSTDAFVLARSGTTKKITAASLLGDGWVSDTDATWTRTADQTFTVTGDRTAVFTKGTRLMWTQTTVKYGVVVLSSHSAGTTTVTIATTTDYVLTAAAISDNYYSYQASPQGYPTFFNYTPAETGWSSLTLQVGQFSVIGNKCDFNVALAGTSDSTSTQFGVPIAVIGGSSPDIPWLPIMARNNGTYAIGRAFSTASGTTIGCGPSAISDTWTASGTKEIYVQAWYEF